MSYETVIFVLHPEKWNLALFGYNAYSILTIAAFLTTIVYAGNKTTKEANKLKVAVSELAKLHLSQDQKIDLILLLATMKLRNLNLETDFFRINWQVLLSVRCFKFLKIEKKKLYLIFLRSSQPWQHIWSLQFNMNTKKLLNG